jgi:hypothetical protein
MAVVAGMFLQASCLPDYFPRAEWKEAISSEEVIGRWRLTEESVRMLANQNITVHDRNSGVEFFHDRSCILQNFVYAEDPISTRGTWMIEHDLDLGGGFWRKNELRISVTSSQGAVTYFLLFSKKRNRLLMWRYLGDPDGRRYIDYVRDKESGS